MSKKKRKSKAPAPLASRSHAAKAVRASSLDSVSYSTDDADYWMFATNATSNEIASTTARHEARKRCRYQYLSDPYVMNMTRTLAVTVVGIGAKIQIVAVNGRQNDERFEEVENRFELWAQSIRLHETIALMVRALVYDGESFLRFVRNPKALQGVSVDLIDAARVTSGWPTIRNDLELDGIRFDRYGNPVEYTVISRVINPNYQNFADFDTIPADEIFHFFMKDLPEQHRGLPLLQSSLKTMAALKRYMMAVVEAAETAACHAFIIESQTLPETESPEIWDAMDEVSAPRRGGTVLPRGWKGSQLKPEQPSTQYAEFIATVLTQAGAGLGEPRNISTNDSSSYNYSSGRLDHQVFFRYVETIQAIVKHLYVFVFRWWYQFDEVSQTLLDVSDPKLFELDWYFAELTHVDPLKEAETAIKLKDAELLTDSEYYGKFGQDWLKQYKQLAEEKAMREKLGINTDPPKENNNA